MTMINDEKPPLSEVLKHQGTKGMKWGSRMAERKVKMQKGHDHAKKLLADHGTTRLHETTKQAYSVKT